MGLMSPLMALFNVVSGKRAGARQYKEDKTQYDQDLAKVQGRLAKDIRGVRADQVETAWTDRIGRALAPARDATPSEDDAGLPRRARLLECLGLQDPTPESIIAGWTGQTRTDVVIGIGFDGPFRIDLRRDGPHALIAGTTGSGKSELLQSIVASLAIANCRGSALRSAACPHRATALARPARSRVPAWRSWRAAGCGRGYAGGDGPPWRSRGCRDRSTYCTPHDDRHGNRNLTRLQRTMVLGPPCDAPGRARGHRGGPDPTGSQLWQLSADRSRKRPGWRSVSAGPGACTYR